MQLHQTLLTEVLKLQKRGRVAVRKLGFSGPINDTILYSDEEDFFHDTAGSPRRKSGYEKVTTDAYPGGRWYPPAIAARVRCLDVLFAWLKPFQIIEELNCGNERLDGWAYIDRAIAALDDVQRAAPAPDPKAVATWRKRKEEAEIVERERLFQKYMTAA
jgi:hypothetical protein